MSSAVSIKKFQFLPFVINLLIPLSIGFIAAFFTWPEIAGWYNTLKKPAFDPPVWLFAPVCAGLYILIGVAAYLIWKHRSRKPVYKVTRGIYLVQLVLNFSWSIVFLGLHQLFGALVIMVLLWISIALTISWFSKFNKTAGWLLTPYLLWVSFAIVLNGCLYFLNS
jgi:tryptophan-rich sensory protein